MRDRRVRLLVVAGVIASAIGIALGLWIHWFPPAASTQAHKIDTLYDVLMIVSIPIFVIVATVVIGSVWMFRMRPGQEAQDGPPIHGNTRLEVLWTAVPVALIAGLCAYAYVVLHDIEKKPAAAQAATREFKVQVTGQQFAWSFQYPSDMTGGQQLVTHELYLPKGRSVEFRIHALDVIHDFWVPAFRMKVDAVPGVTTHYRITPSRLGTYPVVCAELCGLGHAVMRSTVHVLTPQAFQAWLKKQNQPVAAPGAGPGAQAAAGKQVFQSSGCGGCHTLADAGTAGTVGPDLDKFLKGKSAAFIRTSIVNPNAYVEKGFQRGIMPQDFAKTLSKDKIDALVAYLKGVTG